MKLGLPCLNEKQLKTPGCILDRKKRHDYVESFANTFAPGEAFAGRGFAPGARREGPGDNTHPGRHRTAQTGPPASS